MKDEIRHAKTDWLFLVNDNEKGLFCFVRELPAMQRLVPIPFGEEPVAFWHRSFWCYCGFVHDHRDCVDLSEYSRPLRD